MYDGGVLTIIGILAATVALLGLAIWSIKRHKDPQLTLETDLPIERLAAFTGRRV